MCCTYAHAMRAEHKGGFDVVIGNPPYLRVQGLRENFKKESKFYETQFKSATGRFDVYVLFLEKSFSLTKTNGTVSFILPHKFLVSDFGEGIRKFFIQKNAVESILHFGSEMVFSDASAYTCIITLSHKNSNIKFKHIHPSNVFDHFKFESINYSSLTEQKWNFNEKSSTFILNKLRKQSKTLKDIFYAIRTGVDTGTDDIFIMKGTIKDDIFSGYSERLNKTISLESSLMKPMLKGKDSKRYNTISQDHYVIYPHYQLKGKTVPFGEDFFSNNFPKIYNYLLPFKEELINKKIHKKTNPKFWYSLHRSREQSIFEQNRIITPETSLGGNMTIELGNYYHNTQVYSLIKNDNIKEDYKFWLAILNSSLFWFYLQNTGAILRGGYFRFKTKYLEPFPLPELKKIEYQIPFIEKVNFITGKTEKLTHIRDTFTTYLHSQFGFEAMSKKLQSWHKLSFAEFIVELNKAIKKENKLRANINLIPVLSKKSEMDWMEVFEAKKAEAQALQAEIDKTDREIDQMVYELYGLNQEEIKIVEQA